ncbi:unnamed protein product [Heterobilharzia americana]|nr:unnamed protein product [Heterobilharzia americana]
MFKCGRPKMLVCRIEKQINLLSRLHSSANFTDESSDSTQQLYLDGVISTSVVTTASNGFSDLLSEENDAGSRNKIFHCMREIPSSSFSSHWFYLNASSKTS